MPEDYVADVRAFNRFYTARIGVLRDGLDDLGILATQRRRRRLLAVPGGAVGRALERPARGGRGALRPVRQRVPRHGDRTGGRAPGDVGVGQVERRGRARRVVGEADDVGAVARAEHAAEAVRDGGNLTLSRCPADWKGRLRVWGEPRPDWALAERIKAAFDPRGVMNPGRFVGRI